MSKIERQDKACLKKIYKLSNYQNNRDENTRIMFLCQKSIIEKNHNTPNFKNYKIRNIIN